MNGPDMLLHEGEDRRTALAHELKKAQEALQGSEDARLAGEQKLAEVQERLDSTHRAAKLAVAIANVRAGYARNFMEPERLGAVWYAAYRVRVVGERTAASLPLWEDLSPQDRAEITLIATDVQTAYESMLNERSSTVDQVTEGILTEGDELAVAIRQLSMIAEGGRVLWNAFININRKLRAEGFDFLPPGVIVHGVQPSAHPHRPE